MDKEKPQMYEALMRQYLEPTVSASGQISLDRVWLKDSGIHVWAIASSYLEASKEKKSESDRIELVAMRNNITGEAALAGMLYFRRHPGVIAASAFLNSIRDGEDISPQALEKAQAILKDAEGKIDPLFASEQPKKL